MNSYRDLIVWQKAMDFVVDCYKLTSGFPRSELYGLSSQLQRAAVSISSNIAEGAGRLNTREYIRHLGISRGSLFEAETQILISERLSYSKSEQVQHLLDSIAEIGRMLHGLIVSLERRLASEP